MTSQHLQREPDDDVYLDGLLEQVFAKLDTNQRFHQCDRSEKKTYRMATGIAAKSDSSSVS